MIEVNGFWLGVWVASTVILVLLIGIAMLAGRHSGSEQEIDISPEEYKAALEKLTGKPMKIYRDSSGYLVGEPIEDPDDDD